MKTLLSIIFIVFFTSINAQSPQWVNYSIDHSINKILFDGDMWLATFGGGLIKYHTTTQTKIVFNGANSGISSNNVNTIFKDNNDALWIGTVGGVVKFQNNNWTNYTISSAGDTLGGIMKIVGDSNDLYILSQSYQIPGVKIYKFNGMDFVYVASPISSNFVDIDLKSNKLWASYNAGIASFDGSNWMVYDTISTFPGGFSGSLVVDLNNHVWVYRYKNNPNQGFIYKYDGTTWNLMWQGVNIDAIKGTLDPNNNAWFCGYGVNGVIQCSGNSAIFQPVNFPSTNITTFNVDSVGNFYAGFLINGNVLHKRINNNWIPINTSISGISSNYLKDIDIDLNGNKWITGFNGICKFDGYNFTIYNSANSGIPTNYPWSSYIDNGGNIWISGYDNTQSTLTLAKFDGNSWITYNLNGFTGNAEAMRVVQDFNGNICVATTRGLAIFDGLNWTYYSDQNSPIPYTGLYDLVVDQGGVLWMTASGNGLLSFDGINWTVYNTINSGIPSDYSYMVFCDKTNNIWTSSNEGLTKFDGVNWVTMNSQNSNLPFIPGCLAQDKAGNLYGGGMNGLFKFDGLNYNIFNIYNSGVCGTVYGIAIDKANNKWLATASSGLVVFNENGIDPHSVFNLPDSKFEGNIYHDQNSDGIKDTLEYGLSSQKVLILPDSIFTFSNYNGNYSFACDTGSYVSELIPYPNWQVSSDSLLYHIQLDTVNLSGYDYGINAINNIVSVEMELTSYIPRCFTTTNYYITYRNTGTMAVSGTIEFIIDTAVSFITSFPVSSGNVNNLYFWDFIDLKPFETRQIIAQLQLPGVAALGDSLHFTTNMIINQTNTASDSLDQEILCAYDPNDKIVEPVGIGVQHLTLKNETFDYVVRFQNTGNDTAFTVFLIDTLSTCLDISSLEFISSSHPCYVTCTSTGTLRFQFENILLPPSETDDPNSNVYVHYRIKPNTNLPDSTVIFNRAFIYFDFNPPIETNTVFNTLVDNIITGSNEIKFNKRSLVIFPNPATDFIIINYDNEDLFHFELYDLYGRLILNKRSQKDSVEISSLNAGIYLYKVILNDEYFTGKLIISK